MANTRPQTRIEGATYSDYVRMQAVFADWGSLARLL